MEYNWPGNVRELENFIERAVVLCDTDEITADYLPEVVRARAAAETPALILDGGDLSVKRAGERLERELISLALRRTGGNRTKAAELLELSHRALLYKIKEYGLDGEGR
jgi:two-component system response regulator AtoC